MLRYDSLGRFIDTVAEFEDAPRWSVNRGSSWGLLDLVFGRTLVAVVAGAELLIGQNDRAMLDRYDLTGALLGSIPLPLSTRAVTQEDVAEERQRRIEGTSTERFPPGAPPQVVGRLRQLQREALEEVGSYDTAPAFDEVITTPDGGLWVREYPTPLGRTVRWVRVDANGSVAGQVLLDRSSQILDGNSDYLVLLDKDQLDAHVVRILKLPS